MTNMTNKMDKRRYEFVLEARTPIAHHSESLGNEQILMRRKVRQPGGRWAQVPIITGDTMRHGMREAAAYAVLDAAGMLDGDTNLSEGALRLLFAGGTLGGASGGIIKLDRYREMVDLFPPLALFGGCAENRCIPGRLQVDEALLLCDETEHLVPDWAIEIAGSLDSCRSAIEQVTRVRMDPSLTPEKRLLLTDDDRSAIEGRLLTHETASVSGDHRVVAQTKSTMMPRSFERIASGALLYWSVTATVYSELDLDCFHTALAAFLCDARVGGKKGTGHGLLKPLAARQIDWRRPSDRAQAINPNALSPKTGSVFRAHVAARADALREWLSRVAA